MMLMKPVTQQRGFTLIEVLIVFFVLSVGLLGMAALQLRSMQYNQGAYVRSQATVAAYDMLDRLRLNKTVALNGGYDIAWAVTAAPGGGVIETADVLEWTTFLTDTLPTGQGRIDCDNAAGQCTVAVQWMDRLTGAMVNPALSITVQM